MPVAVRIALCLLLSIPVADAAARSEGRVTATPLSYTLIDLAPDDGIAPSIQLGFAPEHPRFDGNRAAIQYWLDGQYESISEYADGDGPLAVSVQRPGLGAGASVAGADSGAPLAMDVTLFAERAGASGQQGMAVQLSPFVTQFVLSPHTGFVVSSTLHVAASVGLPDETFGGGGWLWVREQRPDGGTPTWTDDESVTASFQPGDASSVDRELTLDVTYRNDSAQASSGTLRYWLSAAAISPVPEPGSFALAAAGVGVLFLARRRRQFCCWNKV